MRAVARDQLRALGPRELAEGVLQRLGGQRGIEPRQRVAQPLRQHDLAVVAPLGGEHVRRDVGAVRDLPAGGSPARRGRPPRRRIR